MLESKLRLREKFIDDELRLLLILRKARLLSYSSVGKILGYSRQYAEILSKELLSDNEWLKQEFNAMFDCEISYRAKELKLNSKVFITIITDDALIKSNSQEFLSHLITKAETVFDFNLKDYLAK